MVVPREHRTPPGTAGRAAATVGSGALAAEAAGTAVVPEAAGAETESAADLELLHRSQWRLFLRRFLRHRVAVIAAVVLMLLYLSAIFAEQLAPYEIDPTLDADVLAQARQGPSARHWFGTDQLGRDQLTRILFAGRISLTIGLTVALVSTLLGTAVGSVAGYLGRWVDTVLMRVTDLFLIVPALSILMIAQRGLSGKALFGIRLSSTALIVFILSLIFWQPVARVVRGLILSLKEKEFVEAARASGASNSRIIVRHVLPNCVGPIAVNTTLVVGIAILTESVLSFLGFGVQPPTVSWGSMLSNASGFVGTPQAYLIYFPGLAILLTVLSVNYLGDGLRDAFDPQSIR